MSGGHDITDSTEDMTVEQSADMMRIVFDHYLNHHKAVFKKLHHAKDATQRSYEELEEYTGSLRVSDDAPEPMTGAHAHEAMWGNILEMFKDYGATEEELDAIDTILTEIPKTIKKHYDILVEQDAILKDLISKLHTEEYKRAAALVREVQSRPNPMSGLDAQVYNVKPDQSISKMPKAYKFDPAEKNN